MSRTRSFVIPSVALLVAAGFVPAGAQQRVEVSTRRAPSAEGEPFRLLQRRLDSLTQRYNEQDELTATDRKRLEVEMARVVERLAELMSRTGDEMRARVMLKMNDGTQRMSMPRGWIGIVAEGAGVEPRVDNSGNVIVRYLSYPRIVSVDPSSPAQVAGIAPNDTLLAYDGRDVRENDINLTSLLRPSQRISVRLRRDGRTREVPVVVAEAPSRIALRRNDEVGEGRVVVVLNGMPDGVAPRPAMPVAAGGRISAAGTMRPTMAPTPPTGFMLSVNGVAGAQLVTVSEGLGKRLGVSGGVLVTNAPVGTPASQSGIEDGDVIVKVSGQPVRTVLDVRRLVGQATENGQRVVELELLRDSRTIKTSLRW